MKNLPVILLPRAEEDLSDILLYIFNKSQDIEIATQFNQYLLDICNEKLSFFPKMGRERGDLREGLRYHPVGKYDYNIFYSIEDEELIIESIIQGSQDYTDSFR